MNFGVTIFVIVCMGALVFLLCFLTALCNDVRRPKRVSVKRNEGNTFDEEGVVHFIPREYSGLSEECRK